VRSAAPISSEDWNEKGPLTYCTYSVITSIITKLTSKATLLDPGELR
jgi:hypothetical protein